ncbi:MAG: phosphoribosylformylglycinamidine cyclo-ligase, partial [Candidatus Altiarchaeales archaeon]|nr:phosphoribosylformylglycinamidine cyclo-ligase [Candidatus Altiarchaeales archaeon]
AMNVNDLLCVGAEPLAMVDYLATQYIDPNVNRDISKGIYEGAKKANIAVIGGETATLPEVVQGINNRGFDLAGTAVGVVEKNKIITGEKIRENNVVLGFKSSGIHSNGLTLARKLLPKNMWVDILTPTKIYVTEVLELMEDYSLLGIAHITGSGMRNLLRVTDKGFYIDAMPKIPPIFRKIQELGAVSDLEMYKTFNMGVGLCIVVDEEDGKNIIESYERDYSITRVGKVVSDPGVTIIEEGKEITLN